MNAVAPGGGGEVCHKPSGDPSAHPVRIDEHVLKLERRALERQAGYESQAGAVGCYCDSSPSFGDAVVGQLQPLRIGQQDLSVPFVRQRRASKQAAQGRQVPGDSGADSKEHQRSHDRRLPGALMALVASTILVATLGLHGDGVEVLGKLAHGAPRFGLRGLSWSTIRSVAPLAGIVAFVVVAQSAATTRAFADQGGSEVDVGRDFLGVGAGSIAAGLVGAFPVDASPPRTATVAAASGRTQAAGLGAAAAIVLLVPAAGLIKVVPLAMLAGRCLSSQRGSSTAATCSRSLGLTCSSSAWL